MCVRWRDGSAKRPFRVCEVPPPPLRKGRLARFRWRWGPPASWGGQVPLPPPRYSSPFQVPLLLPFSVERHQNAFVPMSVSLSSHPLVRLHRAGAHPYIQHICSMQALHAGVHTCCMGIPHRCAPLHHARRRSVERHLDCCSTPQPQIDLCSRTNETRCRGHMHLTKILPCAGP